MKKHVIALYGSVSLERGYCNNCQTTSIIKGGKFLCCDGLVEDIPTKFERVSEPFFKRKTPTKNEKIKILEAQEHRCFYCGVSFDAIRYKHGIPFTIKTEWDHKLPFIYSQNNDVYNFVASCNICNGIKSSLLFQTVEEAQVYLAGKRKEKGYDF